MGEGETLQGVFEVYSDIKFPHCSAVDANFISNLIRIFDPSLFVNFVDFFSLHNGLMNIMTTGYPASF